MPNNLSNCFNVRFHEEVIVMLYSQEKKTDHTKPTKFLKEKCKGKEKHCCLLSQKRIRVGSSPFFHFLKKQISVQ